MGRNLDAARAQRGFKRLDLLRRGHTRINQRRDAASARDEFDQNILPLAIELRRKNADPGRVTSRPCQGLNETGRHHVVGQAENWNCLRRGLHDAHRPGPVADDRIDAGFDQLGCNVIGLVGAAEKTTKFDQEIPGLGKAEPGELVEKRREMGRLSRVGAEHANAAHAARVLRARRERPRRRRAAEQRDELAPLHSITSSAMASSEGGIVRPSVRAVWALMTSSNLVDCTTGRSAGFSPLRMRPV